MKNRIIELNAKFQPNVKDAERERLALISFEVSVKNPSPPRGQWLKWLPPEHGTKINFDGSYNKGQMRYGGVLTNQTGNVLLAYSVLGTQGSPGLAESLALFRGLTLAYENDIHVNSIEGDYADILNGKQQYYWEGSDTIVDCSKLLNGKPINHTLRQANLVADALAKAADTEPKVYYTDAKTTAPRCYLSLCFQLILKP